MGGTIVWDDVEWKDSGTLRSVEYSLCIGMVVKNLLFAYQLKSIVLKNLSAELVIYTVSN